jgi:hypothetical protein
MSPKAPPVFKRPIVVSVDAEAKLAELAERAEARGNAVAGEQPESTSLQAREPAKSQARRATKREPSLGVARSGTQAAPYVRARDGEATRSTTVHLPVSLHQQLRMAATEREVHMSAIVTEAVQSWLKGHKGRR